MAYERTFLHLKHTGVRLQTFHCVPHILRQLHTIDSLGGTDDPLVDDMLI